MATTDWAGIPVTETFHCGNVALVGRPNVGKSTLLNALIGTRLSIVGPKPQTTRHRILGIATRQGGQILYIDTPGLHRRAHRAINRRLNRSAHAAIAEVDIAVQVVESGRWTDEDQVVYGALASRRIPRLLVVNKVDKQKDKKALLPFIAELLKEHSFDAVFYASALRRQGLAELEQGILMRLPEQPAIFDAQDITDRSERFLAAELVREQLMLRLDQELPYATTVQIEQFRDRDDGIAELHAVIWVERSAQKAIVIGNGGAQLKAVGSAARRNMQQLIGRRVFLRLWVKVREGGADDQNALKRFGCSD